ncbi:AT-hook-containing transcription factor [Bagarius yarrelli]|uniref:AT-hook-containing transcription factor n=1 Tax=Bagarius yarrelli TaxID=175774 RepID=A0A556TUB4_BAGYA|nr:AT-hook-containing transcription factor [Bagarius yarrelli]
MEGKRVRMCAWTPASRFSSPPSTVSSQLSWDEGRDEDFLRMMDENGIIGLTEMLGELSDQEDEVVLEEEEDVFSNVGTPEPEDGSPTALEDLRYHLSELLDSEPLSQPIGDAAECSVSLEDWSNDEDPDNDDEQKLDEEDQESFNIHRDVRHSRPDRDPLSGVLNTETEEIKMHRDESYLLELNIVPQDNWMDSANVTSHPAPVPDIATLKTRTPSQNSCDERSHASSSPSIQSAPQTHIHPHLPELNIRDKMNNPETKAETFTDLAGSKSCSRTYQPVREQWKKEPAPMIFESEYNSPKFRQKSPVFTPRDTNFIPQTDYSASNSSAIDSTSGIRRHYRPSKTSLTDPKDVRKGQLNHPLPDFSKVEPRVRLPKSRYTPPKSRKLTQKDTSKPEANVMFKSPADIVREALLNNSEGPSDSFAKTDFKSPSNTTSPEEFRCPLQASAIVQQLQEDYNRLLTKYAEAENTIDRLRLEAKVCLHSNPPNPSQPALIGVLKEGSKVMSLNFPQAQRAELGTEAVYSTQQTLSSDSFTSSWRDCPAAAPLTESLSKQMAGFQLQVNDFEKLLKSQRLKPLEQTQGFFQLTQGQESIEKAYLAAREKHHQLHKQTGGKSEPFDPDRELESLIFQSGIQLEELKEWIDGCSEHNCIIESTPSDPPHALQPCASLKETEPQPESPAWAAHAKVNASLEVSSVSRESDEGKDDGEKDMLQSFLRPLNRIHQRVEKDYSNLIDHYQKIKNFPKLLDRHQAEVDHNSLEFIDHSPHPASINRKEVQQQRGRKDNLHPNKPPQQLSVTEFPSGPTCSSHVCNSMETPPEAPVLPSALPRKQDSGRQAAGCMKYHNSQEERAAMRRRASKENEKAMRTQLQDGVITPETDSGFVGSESSRVTPAALSPVQQRTAVRSTRPSVTQKECRIKPESSTQTHAVASGDAPESLGRRGDLRVRHIPRSSASSSPLRWPSTSSQPWPNSGISELEQQSECARSLSDDETRQVDQHTPPSNQDQSYLRCSSLTATYHHGDHLKAQSTGQLPNQHEAIKSLQAEVHRLKEHLEETLRTASPLQRVRAPPSSLKDIRVHTPPQTSTPYPRQRDFRSLEKQTASKREPRETGVTAKSEHKRTVPRRRSASVPRLRPQPDTSTDSEHTQSEDIPASPVKTHTTRRSKAETGRSLKTHSNHRARNISSPSHISYYTNHCPMCGVTKRETTPPPANQSSMKETRPMRSAHIQTGGMYLAVAPTPPVIGTVPVLQCVPVCSSVLYYSSPVASACYQKPLYISESGEKDDRGHRRRSQSLDARRSLNRSLGRVIAAASSVRELSERMVHSLSSGAHHMSPLAKSCTY